MISLMMDGPRENEHGFKYYNHLPEGYTKVGDIQEFLRLRKQARVWKRENIERIPGLQYLVCNPYTEVYWVRKTTMNTNLQELKRYIDDKNVYIKKL